MSCFRSSSLLAHLSAHLGMIVLVALALVLWPLAAQAATILVDGTTCTLPDAISAANTDATVGGCVHDGVAGADILTLNPQSYSLATGTHIADGNNALPSVTSEISIDGNGAVIERSGAANYRLLHVADSGDLTLDNVTLRNGAATGNEFAGDGGAILNRGVITITNSRIFSNTARSSGGGILNEEAAATISNTEIVSNTVSGNLVFGAKECFNHKVRKDHKEAPETAYVIGLL